MVRSIRAEPVDVVAEEARGQPKLAVEPSKRPIGERLSVLVPLDQVEP